MDCGVPFCHTGTLISGMASGCPINNLIPEWNDLVYRGLWQEALERLHKTNNFPEFTGRVCPAPCEGSCVLGINEPPVTIKNIECAIIDRGWDEGWVVPEPPPARTGKKVAVVGSGPAGLAAAAQLNQAGHTVTVFERADRIGGLLMYGIPNMKLDKKRSSMRRIELLEQEGVDVRHATPRSARTIRRRSCCKEFDAVVLCTGATKPRDLPIEGRELKGVHFAMEFLHANTQEPARQQHEDGNFISAKGKDVVVIGGGDTGTDCVGTVDAPRLQEPGSVRNPAASRRWSAPPDNPWPRVAEGLQAGLRPGRSGGDVRRRSAHLSHRHQTLRGRRAGQREGAAHRADRVGQGRGRARDHEGDPGQREGLAGGAGAAGDGLPRPRKRGAARRAGREARRADQRGRRANKQTSVPGVFAAGDMARGQSLIVWAIQEGRAAARGSTSS